MKKIIVTGNVGRDPESRADANGNQFATFSIGVSVGTKQAPKTDWVDVSCNAKLAEIALNYVKKGSKILVEGFPTTNAYINRDNKPVASLRIYAHNLELLSKREDAQSEDYHPEVAYNMPDDAHQQHHAATSNQQQHSAAPSEEIPF